MSGLYLSSILISLLAMTILDWRFSLAFWSDARRALATIAIGVGIFIVWDILGIALGIFFSGHSKYMSGIYLAPDFPIEEIFFLIFLCYFTLIIYRLWESKT